MKKEDKKLLPESDKKKRGTCSFQSVKIDTEVLKPVPTIFYLCKQHSKSEQNRTEQKGVSLYTKR